VSGDDRERTSPARAVQLESVFRRSIALSVEDEVLGALGQAFGDDLGVERVGEDLGPVLEWPVGRDAGRAPVVVAV